MNSEMLIKCVVMVVMFGCMLSVRIFPISYSEMLLNTLDLWIVMSISVPILYVFTHWLVYRLKDLENVDYYYADCKAKSNYELSTSEKCQPNVKYVCPICVCVFDSFPSNWFLRQLYIWLYRLRSLSSGLKPNFVTIFEVGL